MKIILYISFLFISTMAFSQVTVNQYPDIGSKFTVGEINYAEINFNAQIKPIGGNQIWRFDSISIGNFTDTVYYLDPKAFPASKDIPDANLLVYNDLRSIFPYAFFKVNSKEQNMVGLSEDGIALNKFDSPFLFNKFPINYQDEFEGQTTFNFEIAKIEMENFNRVDGWGEITTPSGIYPCLRLKTVTTLLGSFGGVPLLSQTLEEYRWISPGFDYDVFRYQVSEVEEGTELSNDTGAIYLVNQIVTSIKNETKASIDIQLSPNPCKDKLRITLPENVNGKKANIEIFDPEAKIIFESVVESNEVSISVSNWPRGTYMIRVQVGLNSWGLKKLILE